MKKKIFILILFSIFLISIVSAWMPETHLSINRDALSKVPTSPVAQIISNNLEDYIACSSLTDYSVFFYFENQDNGIGKVYLASHNFNICKRAVSMAVGNAQLSCAYGICSHEISDDPSHNDFIPLVIGRTYLTNTLVHALAEEDVNDQILNNKGQLSSEYKNAIMNKYPIHKDFIVKVVKTDDRTGSANVGNMMDAFVSEVTSSSKYSVGFRGFTAIPTSIHIILILFFFVNLTSLALLIRKKKKNLWNKISMVLSFILIMLIILVYVLFLTGNLWKTFQTFSSPLTAILPTNGWVYSYDKAVQNTVVFFNNGVDSIPSLIRDPSGRAALNEADSIGTTIRTIIQVIFLGLSALFIWLNFRKKKR